MFKTKKEAVAAAAELGLGEGSVCGGNKKFWVMTVDAALAHDLAEGECECEGAATDAEPTDAELDDDAAFMASVLRSKKAASAKAAVRPSRATGEIKPPKSGVCKAIWDFCSDMETANPGFVMTSEEKVKVCLEMGWHPHTLNCQWRLWRLFYRGEVKRSRVAEPDLEVTSIDEVEVTEV